MKRFVLGSLTVILAIGLGLESQAQPPRGARMGRGGMTLMGLLAQDSVQKELKLTEEQIKNVKDAAAKQRESFRGLRDLSPAERMAEIHKRIKANEEALAGVIGADQMARLKQISLQTRGIAAFSDPAVVAALALSDEQQEKIKTLQQEARHARQDFDPEKMEESRAKIEAARKAALEKAQGLLTDEQIKKWKELVGAPFTGELHRGEFHGRRRGDRPRGDTPPPNQT